MTCCKHPGCRSKGILGVCYGPLSKRQRVPVCKAHYPYILGMTDKELEALNRPPVVEDKLSPQVAEGFLECASCFTRFHKSYYGSVCPHCLLNNSQQGGDQVNSTDQPPKCDCGALVANIMQHAKWCTSKEVTPE